MMGECEPWILCHPLCKTPYQQTYMRDQWSQTGKYEKKSQFKKCCIVKIPSRNIGEVP